MKTRYEKIIADIREKSRLISHPVTFMELCGTHSQTVAQYGIKNILPENIRLVTGPGCPVCVTDQRDIDSAIGLALQGIPLATYGDMLKIPGSSANLEKARTKGADITIVYDVTEALELKRQKPNLVFFGIGFETTAPMSAWAIKKGLTLYSAHKRFFPAMEALIKNKKLKIDGFIDPGHVSAITGTGIYEKLSVPQVIAGFEAMDVLKSISMLLDQIIRHERKVQNEYDRIVQKKGNAKAQRIIKEVFETADASWRGLGKIKCSGLKIRKKYKDQDAEYVYRTLLKKIRRKMTIKPTACKCDEILQGLREPQSCPLFSKTCSPESPHGPCMVSIEGTCNISYKYGKIR
jgi:hydrogenase expression/formation protein HypD